MVEGGGFSGCIATHSKGVQLPCKKGGIPITGQVENQVRSNLFPDFSCIIPQTAERPLIPAPVTGNVGDNCDIFIFAKGMAKAASDYMDLRLWKRFTQNRKTL